MLLVVLLVLVSLAVARIYFILPPSRPERVNSQRKGKTRSLAVFLGSGASRSTWWSSTDDFIGGHTAEALALVSALDFQRYKSRTYVISQGDILSAQKAADLEKSKSEGSYRILVIPRARRVHQSLLTTPPSALLSLASCIYYVLVEPFVAKKPAFADLLLLNGPGTCVVLCIAVYVNKVAFFLPAA